MVTELERAERRMRQRWYDLALAEAQGQPPTILEKRYEQYLSALRTYTAVLEAGLRKMAS